MPKCPNVNLKEWKDLEASVGSTKAYGLWDRYDGFVPVSLYNTGLNYVLRSVDILTTDRAKQIFAKGQKNNWNLNKILIELQIPKLQKELILSKNIDDREEIIISLLASNSFTVEVNITKGISEVPEYDFDNFQYYYLGQYFESKEDALKYKPVDNTNTSFYSQITVPGGTNYQENEISTPDIVPKIKGHASFSTENGIGWFRSDKKLDNANVKEGYDIDETGASYPTFNQVGELLLKLVEF
ncbi:hypothetical protein LCGC14_2580370 [marine sediment metagenome]|uniref:Uncharacterized protein n=1 Tax=marine sediment metagenome TaxID=412755 RepID=A0A0F9AEZ9_9ZZZZ